MKQLQHIRWR